MAQTTPQETSTKPLNIMLSAKLIQYQMYFAFYKSHGLNTNASVLNLFESGLQLFLVLFTSLSSPILYCTVNRNVKKPIFTLQFKTLVLLKL